jgi:hypothetical protein
MKELYFIILVFCACSSAAQDKSNYYDALFKGGSIDLKDAKTKKTIAAYLSCNNDSIPVIYIRNIEIEKNNYIINYGKADLIKVLLTPNAPTVLKSVFLIIVNHEKKELNKISVDHYYSIKTDKKQKSMYISGINNFRGNLQLLIYKYTSNGFTPFFTENINVSNDCLKYKYDTVDLKNEDTNKDGKLDIVISYIEQVFCDKDGSESEKPIEEKNVIKTLFFRPNYTEVDWQLKQ